MKTVLSVLAFVAALGVVGSFDYEDAQNQELLYCDNVKAGTWPDYEGTYDEVCAKTHGPKKVVKTFVEHLTGPQIGLEFKPSQHKTRHSFNLRRSFTNVQAE